ncbi:MAG TPA: hypothetical protein VF804_14035 [Holophagaceae bacterium]
MPLPLLPLAAMVLQAPSAPPAPISAEPGEVRPGESVLLTWACPDSPSIRLDPGGLILPGRSQATVRPTYTTTYRIFDARPGGPELGHVDVRVRPDLPLGEPARICTFDASATTVLPGQPVVLRWQCAGSAKVRLEPGGMELDGKSEVTVTPQESTRYTITATNAAGGQSRTVEVAVMGHAQAAVPAMVCSFGASARKVQPGQQVVLHWECQGHAKVRLEPGGLELDGLSSIGVMPEKTTVYTLSVSNLTGGVSHSLEVQVEPPRLVLSEKDLLDPEEARKPLDQEDLPEALRRGAMQRDQAPAGAWTLRLVVSGYSGGLKQVARAAGKTSPKVMILPYVRRDGLRWWQGCYGAYPSRTTALKAWRTAPEELRRAFHDAFPLRLAHLPGDPPSESESAP